LTQPDTHPVPFRISSLSTPPVLFHFFFALFLLSPSSIEGFRGGSRRDDEEVSVCTAHVGMCRTPAQARVLIFDGSMVSVAGAGPSTNPRKGETNNE
jgi:hypothetical protein